MTCIAGVVHKGKVWIGGDSAGVCDDHSLTVRSDRKVFVNGDFIMGFTTSFRMGQLLNHSFVPPQRHADQDVMRFMVTDFVNAVRECLKTGGYAERENEVESGGTFLVGYKGRLFMIGGDYQVGEAIDGFDAVGCGSDIAKGSLYASAKLEPRKRIEMALRAAERFSGGVRAPFHYVSA
jgi:ATP-dependent protease HslVU (ClpYQ) peptidase subunit